MEVENSNADNTASDNPAQADHTNEYLEYHEYNAYNGYQGDDEDHEYHDYSEDDAATKMHHLMHSDTIIVVVSLVVMIIVGLVFRSLCMKLASINERKERVRGGLKQIAESMHYVTRSMSNDLELPDSPRAVIRTYSKYKGKDEEASSSPPKRGDQHSNSLRVHAMNNNLNKVEREELEMQMSVAQSVSISIPPKAERWHQKGGKQKEVTWNAFLWIFVTKSTYIMEKQIENLKILTPFRML